MRRLAAVLALFAALAVAVPRAALALEIPPHGGQWVVDLAGLLPPADKNALGAELRRYAEASGNQIVVLTVPSLEGENIAAYANRVARQWGVGAKSANTGVLILVAKAEARVRFEVGRGLEDRLTDALSKRIQRETAVPHFRAGRFGQGLAETVAAIEAALGPGGQGAAAPASGQPAAAPARKQDSGFSWLTLGLVVLATVLAIAVLSRRRGPGGYGGGFGPGTGAPQGGYDDGGGRGSSFLLGMLLGMFSSRWRGPGGPGGFGGGGGDGGFSGGGGDFGGGGSDSGFGGGDDNS